MGHWTPTGIEPTDYDDDEYNTDIQTILSSFSFPGTPYRRVPSQKEPCSSSSLRPSSSASASHQPLSLNWYLWFYIGHIVQLQLLHPDVKTSSMKSLSVITGSSTSLRSSSQSLLPPFPANLLSAFTKGTVDKDAS